MIVLKMHDNQEQHAALFSSPPVLLNKKIKHDDFFVYQYWKPFCPPILVKNIPISIEQQKTRTGDHSGSAKK
ncbi:hypothetical protein [Flavobacterium sp. XGLA_31]|uniref:hypothetical protein n=1 Tax=Flavobacterium sp. XGLA_31 TaxID=3447666 RepID=UPI003F316AE7